MKRQIFLTILCLASGFMSAQTADTISTPDTLSTAEPHEERIYDTSEVETQAQFRGGEKKLMAYLNDNLHYPAEAIRMNVAGKVFVQFVVEKDGKISNAKVFKSVHPVLDREAERVIRRMPKWKPATIGGQPVHATYILPITFRRR